MRMDLRDFIKEQLSDGFEEFVTLYCPDPKKPWEHENNRPPELSTRGGLPGQSRTVPHRYFDLARTYQKRWLRDVTKYRLPYFSYLLVIENRSKKQDFLFHLLLRGCDWGSWDFEDHWKPLWKQISGGTAFARQLDERVGGLICYFVKKKFCTLELPNGTQLSREDFDEWNRY
jgi:hypothetical protein